MPGTDRGRPWLFDTYLLNVLIKALFFAIAAVTVDLLWGYTGYLTFGQSAFFGVGAYAAGLAFTHFGFARWRRWLCWRRRWPRRRWRW